MAKRRREEWRNLRPDPVAAVPSDRDQTPLGRPKRREGANMIPRKCESIGEEGKEVEGVERKKKGREG